VTKPSATSSSNTASNRRTIGTGRPSCDQSSQSGRFKGVAAYRDFRKIIGRDDIDAVAIVTPDHWHRVMTVMAANAGKDIFCQKPMTLTVRDGQEMTAWPVRWSLLALPIAQPSSLVRRHVTEFLSVAGTPRVFRPADLRRRTVRPA